MDEPEDGAVRRSPTIYDVAAAAGVAPSTVSRAFSRPGRVNAETAARIRAIAADLGYRANPLARALPTGRTSMLAVIVSDVTNPFFFEIIRGVEAAAADAGYVTLLVDTHESPSDERAAIDRAIPMVDAIVLATSRMSDNAIRMIAKQRPTVVLNRPMTDVPSLVSDNPRGMRRAVEHLGELGHRAVTYVAGPEASWADGMRWRSIREAVHELEMRVHRIGPYPPTLGGGFAAVRDLAQAPTTAVVAYNDLMAIGLMRGLSLGGVRVPHDVSVIGFDNIFGADFCSPALTTVAAPLRALGTVGVQLVLGLVSAGGRRGSAHPSPVRPAMLPAQLVVRESTGPRRSG
ncbi:LacI family DNA-binding transcriptional regulator [Cellulomonas sp. KRMCY2]|uniref:LacI family DNA-binding transcriptional regulator n=1 Tax=Cellulomonas sp. KRMCY2 TaxID=1304865 RepID=UPI0004A2E401|nr:LacI family DNA-binding transcriptional regulator [Cellulomonas sp. KRMCY2]